MKNPFAFLFVALLLSFGLPATASAYPSKNRQENTLKEREARKACLAGDYAKGVALLSELFLDSRDAAYIFNQGRCYQQNDRYEAAISKFREYLRMTEEDKDTAQKHIAECEALLGKTSTAPALASLPASQPPSPMLNPAAVAPTSVVIPTPAAPQEPVQRAEPVASAQAGSISPAPGGARKRVAGVIVAGVGALGLITGVALNLKANSVADSITPPKTYDRSKDSTRKTYETMSWIGYGVGAAAVVTGAVLYALGWNQGRGGDVAFAPAFGPDMVGATIGRAF